MGNELKDENEPFGDEPPKNKGLSSKEERKREHLKNDNQNMKKDGEDANTEGGIDAKEIIRKLYTMHQDLEQKLQYIEQNLHHIPEELKKIAEYPEKIIKDHDEIVAKYEKDLEDKVVAALGKSLYFGQKKKKKKKISKRGRKVQKLRGRKKWIPMQ